MATAPVRPTAAPLRSRPVRPPAPHKPNLLEQFALHMGRSISRATARSGSFLKRVSYVGFVTVIAVMVACFIWFGLHTWLLMSAYSTESTILTVATTDGGTETIRLSAMSEDETWRESYQMATLMAATRLIDPWIHVAPVMAASLITVIITAIGLRGLHKLH
jgi:hypothetical protein